MCTINSDAMMQIFFTIRIHIMPSYFQFICGKQEISDFSKEERTPGVLTTGVL